MKILLSHAVLPLFAVISCLEIAMLFALRYRRIDHRREDCVFAWLSFFLAMMILSTFFQQEMNFQPQAQDPIVHLNWFRAQLTAICGAVSCFLHFSFLVTGRDLPNRLTPRRLYGGAMVLATGTLLPSVLHPGKPGTDLDLGAIGLLFYPWICILLSAAAFGCWVIRQGMSVERQIRTAVDDAHAAIVPSARGLFTIIYRSSLLIVAAAVVETLELVLDPREGIPQWANPRAIAATLFCGFTGWALMREMLEADIRNQRLDALARGRLAAMTDVEHDLKNAISAIKMPVAVVVRGMSRGMDPVRQAAYLVEVTQKADELYQRLDALLNLARMDAGEEARLEPRREIDLESLLKDIGSRKHRQLLRAREAENVDGQDAPDYVFRIESDIPVPALEVHPYSLQIVLENLLDNAVKYSPHGGEIVLRLTQTEREAVISVVDHGIGITATDADRLFQVRKRFYRGRAENLNIVLRRNRRHGIASEGGRNSKERSEVICLT